MIQDYKAKVVEKKNLTDDVIFLKLNIPNFTFKAGQYIMLKMFQGEKMRLKPYSILSPPNQDSIDLCVKLIDGGFASEIFKEIQEGHEFDAKGPLGHFVFDEEAEDDNWFICTGTGVTPMYSMVAEFAPKFPNKKFTLLFGVRTKDDLFYQQEFQELANNCPNFSYILTLTKEEWDGKTGRVQKHFPENLHNKTFYICGLKELVLDTKEFLIKEGVDQENVKFERYS